MCIFIFLFTLSFSIADENFNVTDYKAPLIQEEMGSTYMYNEIWRTMYFVYISDFTNQCKSFTDHLNSLHQECKYFKNCNSMNLIDNLLEYLEDITERTKTLNSIINNARNKRGLIDGIGIGLNFLFGTIDANDAKAITKSLDDIYNHSSNSILLVKKQTTLMKVL